MAVREVCPVGLNLGTAHLSFADPNKAFSYPFIFFLKTPSSRFLIVLNVDACSDPEYILILRSFGILF